jgi:RNA processing factor Prp31
LFAAKSLKDIIQNVKEFSNSSAELKFNRFKDYQKAIDQFNTTLREILQEPTREKTSNNLQELLLKVENDYQQDVIKTYQQVNKGDLKEIDISTVFNLNKEVHDSCKSLIMATKDFLLNETEIVTFNNMTTK